MATKLDPGPSDVYANAKPDEPIFILLGRDPMASVLIRLWVQLRERFGEDRAKLEDALRTAVECEEYATKLGKGPLLEEIFRQVGRL